MAGGWQRDDAGGTRGEERGRGWEASRREGRGMLRAARRLSEALEGAGLFGEDEEAEA